jgi:Ca2+-transporting ATPase
VIVPIHTKVPGRARYHVDALYRSTSCQQRLEEQLNQHPHIQQVCANPFTGNILVWFDDTLSVTDIAQQITHVIQANSPVAPAPTVHRNPMSEPSPTNFSSPSPAWHQYETDALLAHFATSSTEGLTTAIAQQRLEQYGQNLLKKVPPRSAWRIFFEQFNSIPVALLTVAAVLSGITSGLADTVTIMGVVAINAVIGYVTESESEKIVRGLYLEGHPAVMVIRDGQIVSVMSENLVPGDIVPLKAGLTVPADLRLLQGTNLCVDESMLTGESVPVNKSPGVVGDGSIPLGDRRNLVYQGTFITAGEGLGLVVATGQRTEMGQISALLGEGDAPQTPLQKQLDQAGGQLAALSSGVCAVVFGLGLLRGYGGLEMLKTAIALAVAAVPEGLPAVATTTLALGIREMRQRHIIVRGLNTVEALGSIQTICLDKTGTLTQNKMLIQTVAIDGETLDFEQTQLNNPAGDLRHWQTSAELEKILQVAILCNDCDMAQSTTGVWQISGSPTETALIEWAIALGIDPIGLRQDYPRQALFDRSENCNVMTTLHSAPDGQSWIALKGSPEEVLALCQTRLYGGQCLPLTDGDRRGILATNDHMANQALRVLGFAYGTPDQPLEVNHGEHRTAIEQDLIWLGLTGMADPIREGVSDLIDGFYQAGIFPVMVTGDQRSTAQAIGQQIRLERDRPLEIIGAVDLAKIDTAQWQTLGEKINIYARISPADKLQVVKAIQATGRIVAMTGDGINDAPALKYADVGIAMGSGKADIVRDVADAIIEDDNLSTLIDAIRQGRTVYSNIRKAVHFLLATNFGEIAVMTAATALGLGSPLNAMQLLWLNLVTDIFPGLALALEPPEPDVLDRPPRDPSQPILGKEDYFSIVLEGSVISVSALLAYGYALGQYGFSLRASTIAFMSLTIAQILHTYACRSDRHSIFESHKLPHNSYINGAVLGTLALQLAPLLVPGLRDLIKLDTIDLADSLVIGLAAIVPLLINETSKHFANKGARSS